MMLTQNAALYAEVSQFLALEAMLLDEGRFDEWFDLLHDDLDYRMPLRLAADKREDEYVPGAMLIHDTKPMIRIRIDRLNTGLAHAEAPPSRTVRSVSSICILDQNEREVHVSSALILYRHRGTDVRPEIFHARRDDVFRSVDGAMRLASRTVKLAETSLSAANVAVFF